jgi:hypothetical protein
MLRSAIPELVVTCDWEEFAVQLTESVNHFSRKGCLYNGIEGQGRPKQCGNWKYDMFSMKACLRHVLTEKSRDPAGHFSRLRPIGVSQNRNLRNTDTLSSD